MYPVLKIMHMLNFLDMFSVGVTKIFSSHPCYYKAQQPQLQEK